MHNNMYYVKYKVLGRVLRLNFAFIFHNFYVMRLVKVRRHAEEIASNAYGKEVDRSLNILRASWTSPQTWQARSSNVYTSGSSYSSHTWGD